MTDQIEYFDWAIVAGLFGVPTAMWIQYTANTAPRNGPPLERVYITYGDEVWQIEPWTLRLSRWFTGAQW